MRCKAVVLVLMLAIGSVVGCTKRYFIPESVHTNYSTLGLSQNMETDPDLAASASYPFSPHTPTTILDPDRPIRWLSLAEAIAIALEQGNIGNTNALFAPGFNLDNLVALSPGSGFGQGGVSPFADDSIRVLSLQPAIEATAIEASLSKFDAVWASSMVWNKIDRPVGTALDTFQAARADTADLKITNASFNTGLIKPLPTGGIAGITFSTDYELSNLDQRVNPAYRPVLQFEFEQPLLRGAGVAINQLLAIPPERLNATNSVFRRLFFDRQVEGILITRIRFDQSRAEFERNVQFLLLNVEAAYWNLYGSYWTLYSREQGLRQAYEAWKINKARYEAGRIPIQDFANSRQQYETFRSQRIQALGEVLERERQLRGLLGMPTEDGYRLVPSDEPTMAPFQPDWATALNEAMALHPSLILAREEVKVQQLLLLREQNRLLPDLRILANYDVNAIGSRLDGQNAANAFRNLALNDFNSWGIGLRLDVPIGFRNAHAGVRALRLQLLQAYNVLRDQELKAERFLALEYRRLFEFHEQIEAQRSLREAAATQLDARFKEFIAGRGTLDFLLEAQRVWADALRAEFDFVVQYNTALAGFQFAKGTILQYNNVHISEGPLPACAQVRAVEHERERTAAIVAKHRAIPPPPRIKSPEGLECVAPPHLPVDDAPPLPMVLNEEGSILKSKPSLPPVTSARPAPDRTPGMPGAVIPASAHEPQPLPVIR